MVPLTSNKTMTPQKLIIASSKECSMVVIFVASGHQRGCGNDLCRSRVLEHRKEMERVGGHRRDVCQAVFFEIFVSLAD